MQTSKIFHVCHGAHGDRRMISVHDKIDGFGDFNDAYAESDWVRSFPKPLNRRRVSSL